MRQIKVKKRKVILKLIKRAREFVVYSEISRIQQILAQRRDSIKITLSKIKSKKDSALINNQIKKMLLLSKELVMAMRTLRIFRKHQGKKIHLREEENLIELKNPKTSSRIIAHRKHPHHNLVKSNKQTKLLKHLDYLKKPKRKGRLLKKT